MNLNYRVVESIIFLEFFLIIVVIFAAMATKMITYIKEKNNQLIRIHIKNYLNHLIEARRPFQSHHFPHNGRRIDLLLFILHEFDNQYDEGWSAIKLELIRTIILPLARKAAVKSNWALQFYAAQAFEIYAEKKDARLITRLIDTNVPIIRLAALQAALNYGSETAFKAIIDQIKNEPYLTQSIYLQAFTNASLATRPFITKQLKIASAPNIRLTCYRILLNYPVGQIDWDIYSDIYSKNKKITLAALRLIAYIEPYAALPLLIEQLKNNYWKAKVVALNALGYLPAQAVIPQIAACLHDKNWKVRLNAAQALKNLGEKGEQALISNKLAEEPIVLEVVRHVLKIL